MLKRLILFLAVLIAIPAFAQEVVSSEAELAFIRVRQPDGTYKEIRDGALPISIKPIVAQSSSERRKNDKRGRSLPGFARGKSPMFGGSSFGDNMGTVVYQNDGGNFYFADSSNSVLDDIVLANGSQNMAWTIVKFGVHFPTNSRSGKFLVRWRSYATFVSGQGAGVSAFEDESFDIGFYLERSLFSSAQSTFEVTVDLSFEPLAIVPNLTNFFAQQFREPQTPVENGEGTFTDIWNVFSDQGPQVGSSEDLFFLDTPPDGVYDETEIENFGDGFPGAANFMFSVQVPGSTNFISPSTFNWVRGNHISGNVGSLWFLDNNYNVAKAGITLFSGEPPAQLVTETFVPSATPLGFSFSVTSKTNTSGLGIRIELYNFVTDSWDVVKESSATTSDSTVLAIGGVDPTIYIDPVNLITRSKVSYYQTGLTLVWPWQISVNKIGWVLTFP